MFRNCFRQRLIGLVVLIVLEEQIERTTSDGSLDVLKTIVRDNTKQINDRKAEPETKQGLPEGYFVDGGGEIMDNEHGREASDSAGTDPGRVARTEALAYAPHLFVSRRKRGTRSVPVRNRRQMVEHYVDDPDGIIETIQSNGRQYHVAHNARHDTRDQRNARDISNGEETEATPKATGPPLENDDHNEDVFFSGVKPGQNRDAVNLFLVRSKAGANTQSHGVIGSINDVPGIEAKEWLPVEYKETGVAGNRDAEQAQYLFKGRNLSFLGNISPTQRTTLLRRIVRSVLNSDAVAGYLAEASRRSERRKRQILEYFVDSVAGKIEKRDTSNARQISTMDRATKRRISAPYEQVEALARDAYENNNRKERGVNWGDSAEEAGRSADNDSDDLENVLRNRAQSDEMDEYTNDDEQRLGSDDVSFNVRRRNYVTGDDIADENDVRGIDKRRLAYDEESPPRDVHEEDFYYVEDEEEQQEEGSLVKREAEQADRKLDQDTREFKDVEEEAQKSQRSVPPSQEESTALSKELVEIIIQEVNDRFQGKRGNPELQVRGSSNATGPQGEIKTEIPAMPKQFLSASVGDKERLLAGKLRDRRRASSHRSRSAAGKKRRSDLLRLENERKRAVGMPEESVKPSSFDTEKEKAEDVEMVKQIVAIVINRAVKHLRSHGRSEMQGQTAMGQLGPNALGGMMDTGPVGPPQPPPPVNPAEVAPQPTSHTFWEVDNVPGVKVEENGSLVAPTEYFVGGFHYQLITFPPGDVNAQPTHNESQPKRRHRRHGLTDHGRSVRAVDDFSSSAAKTVAGERVFAGVESSIFCRVIRRLVDKGKLSQQSYDKLLSNKTCFDFPGPSRRRVRRSFFQHQTVRPCVTNGHFGCVEMSLPPIDLLTGSVSDWRCQELIYVATYPSVFNFNEGRVTTRIPMWLTNDMGGYIWGGRGSGMKPPDAPQKRNSAWGVVFAFTTPIRLWGLRFIETPATVYSVLSIAVYLQKSDDLQNRWTPVTEAGSAEPKIIPATRALINFTEIHNVTGVLIFLQEWQGTPMLPHPVFIACSAESSLESTDPYRLPIALTRSWDIILNGIARESGAYEAMPKRDL